MTIPSILRSTRQYCKAFDTFGVKDTFMSTTEPPVIEGRDEAIAGLVTKYKMALNNKKRRTLREMTPSAFHAYELGLIVSRCCRDMDLEAAFAAYMSAKNVGVTPGSETFCNLLSLTAGLGTQGSGQAMVREREPPHNLEAAMVVYADMLSHNMEVPEASYTAIIRCCCINQQPFRGLKFYRDMQKLNITPKLRTFTSLLEALSCHDQHLVDTTVTAPTAAAPAPATTDSAIECGFALYDEMLRTYALEPSEKEFLCMLRLCLQSRDPRFYAVLTAFSETGIIPVSPELHRLLTAWFTTVETGYQVVQSAILKDGTVAMNQEKLRSLDVDEAFRAEFLKQLESFAVTIDENKKIKVNNKVKEQQQIQAMKLLLQQGAQNGAVTAQDASQGAHSSGTAESAAEAGADSSATDKDRSKGATTPAARQELWTDFTKYLRFHRESEPKEVHQRGSNPQNSGATVSEGGEAPAKRARYEHEQSTSTAAHASNPARAGKSGFNIIVDGANVGYFRQNYLGAPNHVNYQQIDQLLQHLRALGHRPLLILHSRHCSKFMVPNEECEGIIRRWRSENCMYATPKGFNDDWFWLYAAVAHRCKVVTNDEMRDHHFQLLSPKWFNRWRERNRVQFTFGAWQDQQLKQQQRSVISGSSNSFSNTATLRALQFMPVSLTSDMPAPVLGGKEEGGGKPQGAESDVSECDSSDEDELADSSRADADFQQRMAERAKAKELKKAQLRRVSLRWPCPYSYCLQHIQSARGDGYYCPPVPVDDGKGGEEVPVKDTVDAGVFGATGDSATKEWLCVFKASS